MKKSWKENKGKNKDRIGLCNSVARGISSNKSVRIFPPALILMLNLALALKFLFKGFKDLFKSLINSRQLIINSKRVVARALTTVSSAIKLVIPIAVITALITLTITAAIVTIPVAYAAGTVSHPASHVTTGTFDTGNFTFPNYLFINQSLGIGTTGPGEKLDVNGGLRVASYYKRKFLGTGGMTDYDKVVILLHERYTTTLLNANSCIGTIYASRGNASAGNRKAVVRINTGSAYNSNFGSIESLGEKWKLVTCTYGGKYYMAVEVPYSPPLFANGFYFDGLIRSTAEELVIVPYYDVNTSTVLNAEVNDSIADFTPNRN